MISGTDDGLGLVCRSAHTGNMTGIRVYRDSRDHWVASRPIWNQHGYFVTNVNVDGSIPPLAEAAANWLQPGLNSFRQNAPGSPIPQAAPDLTVEPAGDAGSSVTCDGQGQVTAHVKVCNRGLAPVALGVSVAFYDAKPVEGLVALCTSLTTIDLQSNQCEGVSCSWTAPGPPTPLWAAVDGAPAGQGEYLECVEGNNFALFHASGCP